MAGSIYSQTINLRFSSHVYTWDRFDSLNLNGDSPKTLHVTGYQNVLLNVSVKDWSVNTLFQAEEDIVNKTGDVFKYRFYNLYLKGSNLFNLVDVKLGRQYVFAGVGKGAIDGGYLKIKAGKNKEYQAAVYGGFPVLYSYEFKKYPKLKENYFVGGQLSYFGVRGLEVSASFTNRHHKPVSYTTTGLDSIYNTVKRTIDIDSPADQLAGIDINYLYVGKHFFYAKAYYDINLNKLYRGEFSARLQVTDQIRLSAGYTYREPQLSYNTLLWVFEHKPTQEIEGGLDYTFKNGIVVYARASGVLYQDDNSIRIQAGMYGPFYGLTAVRYMGYAGESDGVTGYYNRELVKNLLTVTSSVSFSRYRLGDYDTDKVNSLSGMLGLVYRPHPQFSVDAEGQFLINRIYKSDFRFLVGFNYWLFKKFN